MNELETSADAAGHSDRLSGDPRARTGRDRAAARGGPTCVGRDGAGATLRRPPLAPRPRRRRLLQPAGWRQSLALALVLLLVLASAAFAALPSVRDAVLELLGLQGATVERRAELPVAPELRPLRLGERVSLADAENALGFTPLLPGDLQESDAVFVCRDILGGELPSRIARPRTSRRPPQPASACS